MTSKRYIFNTILGCLSVVAIIFLILALCPIGYAASNKNETKKAEADRITPAPVVFADKTMFFVQARVLSFSPQERAKFIENRINKLAKDSLLDIDKIGAINGEASSDIAAGDVVIMSVTEEDAKASGKSRPEIAQEYARIIKSALREQKKSHSIKAILYGAIISIFATALFVYLVFLLKRIFFKIYTGIESSKKTRIPAIKFQKLVILSSEQMANIIIKIIKLSYLLIIVFGLYLYVAFILRFFPWTKNFSSKIISYITTPVKMIGDALMSYLPDFFVLLVIIVFTNYLLKFVKFIFSAIEKEFIKFPGFFPEWAKPSYAIAKFMIIAFSAVVAFPYLPGSDAPAFKGVSIFIGVLLSLGSTAAVANLVAGIILTYMRAFKVGDRVKISETFGDVIDKALLVTRVQTIKNEHITIPNTMVLGSHIINYSSSIAQRAALILHTSVTIGYDAPWRKVHELLIDAAKNTKRILDDPPPFVLQTALNDFYVSYELNAYTNEPAQMAVTYSELHQSIQDKFNEGGIEIMSPHYSSLRDGNTTTIPENYLPEDYTSPTFRVSNERKQEHEKV